MFVAEALDHLSSIESLVLQLEATPDDVKLLNDVFRPFHTVKGNAGALGVVTVQELAHKIENLLDLCRSGRHAMGPEESDITLRGVDVLTAMISDLHQRTLGKPGRDFEPERLALMASVEALIGDGDHDAATPVPQGWPVAHQPADEPPAPGPLPAFEPSGASHGRAGADDPSFGAPDPPSAASRPAQPVASVARDGLPDAASIVDAGRRSDSTPPVADRERSAAPMPTRRTDDLPQASVKVDTRKLDNLVDMVGELVIVQSIIGADPALSRLADESLTRNLAQLQRITSDLQRNAMSMRMVPIRQTFQKMARVVRDLSKKSGKLVELSLTGEDTELDRRVVEDINDPLMHMVRNSLDHGLESQDARTAAGKRPEGRLSLSAYHQGGNIVIAISDDGAGLNTERILSKAVSQGLVSPGAALSPAEVHQLIFQPGFSTAEKVTEISGRGVGMDVVKRNIEALRGRIDIQSSPGEGTTFLIKLPLTLAILDGLVLSVGHQRYVMPTFSVRESLRPAREQVHTVQGEPRMIQVRDRLFPLARLAGLFGLSDDGRAPWEATVVVIEDDGQRVGLVVDELLGKQEVVIKSLGETFAAVEGLAGGAILGDGRVGLILDAHGIIARHSAHARAA
ncbi:MAG: chemotaxis protein CheA [Acidobacteria bacterium]|nr:chemotaxis protein CheA [Acidobacteriota bacterium]